jgi:hypothetical protein
MTKPTDDLEAVRAVVEALQGFEAGDQERIIRWAREKLGLVESLAPPPSTIVKPRPSPVAFDRPAPPIVTPAPRKLEIVERPVVEAPRVEQPVVQRPVVSVPQVEAHEPDQAVVDYLEVQHVEPTQQQPEAVNMLMPAPEQKNRAFLIIGIIVMAIAVGFLILMIMSHGK